MGRMAIDTLNTSIDAFISADKEKTPEIIYIHSAACGYCADDNCIAGIGNRVLCIQ